MSGARRSSRSKTIVTYALVVGAVGGGGSAIAQATNAEGWVFVILSVLAFPFVGVSIAIQSFVAVVTGYLLGNALSVLISGLTLFTFFAGIAAVQALAWTAWGARRELAARTRAEHPAPPQSAPTHEGTAID